MTEVKGFLRDFRLSVPEAIYTCNGIKICGRRIKSVLFSTDVSIIRNSNADARSLNLSNSVAIGVYEVLRQWNYPKLLCEGKLRDYEWDV